MREHSGDECDLASILCMYDLRKGDLFVLGWARVRRGSISSEMLLYGGSGRSILLLPLETIYVYIYMAHVCFMSAVVTVGVCGNVV